MITRCKKWQTRHSRWLFTLIGLVSCRGRSSNYFSSNSKSEHWLHLGNRRAKIACENRRSYQHLKEWILRRNRARGQRYHLDKWLCPVWTCQAWWVRRRRKLWQIWQEVRPSRRHKWWLNKDSTTNQHLACKVKQGVTAIRSSRLWALWKDSKWCRSREITLP